MIRGRLAADRSILLPLTLLGKRRVTLRALADTGFSGTLCLSSRYRLSFPARRAGFQQYELADGRVVKVLIFTGRIVFDGRELEIPFSFTRSRESLVGTELLARKSLRIWFRKRRFALADDR